MVDMAMISGTMSALKAAGEITKLMIASHDANVIRQKAIELQTQIFTAQQNALTAQSDQFTLLQQVRDLESQNANLKAWESEKQRYELRQLHGRGAAFAYSPKVGAQGAEPFHCICAACYQRGAKTILQFSRTASVRSTEHILKCPACQAEVHVDGWPPRGVV
jgi:hypothetical protein